MEDGINITLEQYIEVRDKVVNRAKTSISLAIEALNKAMKVPASYNGMKSIETAFGFIVVATREISKLEVLEELYRQTKRPL